LPITNQPIFLLQVSKTAAGHVLQLVTDNNTTSVTSILQSTLLIYSIHYLKANYSLLISFLDKEIMSVSNDKDLGVIFKSNHTKLTSYRVFKVILSSCGEKVGG
jgi:hypothetical protein